VRIREGSEALAHRHRRIGPGKSAGVRHSDEESLGLGGVSGEEGKGAREEVSSYL
jgi:hypothetical protein